jgi:hypothetical protein
MVVARARRIAWTGALVSAAATEAIGLFVALFPKAWLGLFTCDAQVLAAGASYLHVVAPFYGAVGLGFLLYFVSQGAGRVMFPFFAGTVRPVVAAGIGWLAVAALGAGPLTLFAIVAPPRRCSTAASWPASSRRCHGRAPGPDPASCPACGRRCASRDVAAWPHAPASRSSAAATGLSETPASANVAMPV